MLPLSEEWRRADWEYLVGGVACTLKKEIEMGLWLALLVLALIALVVGFVTAAKWLFIIAVVLLLVGLFTGFRGGWGARRTTI